MCTPRVTRHTSIRYSSSCHTRVNIVVTLTSNHKPSLELLQILKEQNCIFLEQSAEIVKEDSAWEIVEREKTLLVKEKGNF
jgi:hypothetical protein